MTPLAALILATGAGVFAAGLLYAAITTYRLTGRLRAVEQRLANLAQINDDLRTVNTVPDAATPELAAEIDIWDLPRRTRTPDQDNHPTPLPDGALTPDEDAAWQDLAARLEAS